MRTFLLAPLLAIGFAHAAQPAAQEIRVEPEIAMASSTPSAKKQRPRATRSLKVELAPPSEAERSQVQAAGKGQPQKIGFPRALARLEQDLRRALDWERVGDADVASMTIFSPEAAALRLGLRVDKVPHEATLRLHDGSGETLFEVSGAEISAVIAANAAAGDRGAEGRTWWSPVIEASAATLEIELPAGTDAGGLRISLPTISHLVTSAAQGFLLPKAVGDSGSCHNDATCQAGAWSAQMNAVAKMIFSSGGSSYTCTGTLLADNDATTTIPYFITANHCIGSQTVANTIVNYWFYRSTACNSGVLGPYVQQAAGSGTQFLYNSTATDVAFLRLGSNPPAGVTYAGWKSTPGLSAGAAVTALHHPAGDLLKYSTGSVSSYHTCTAPNSQGQFSCSTASSGSSTFYGISWNNGVTQGGSSGSALFDSGKYVVGQLYGGGSSCSTPNETDLYGRFDVSFAAGFSTYLNPPPPPRTLTVGKAGTSSSGSVSSSPSGINCGSTCTASYTAGSTVTLTASPVAGVSSFAGWGGACSGLARTCTVTMDAAKSVTAFFNQDNGVAVSPTQLIFGTTQSSQPVTITNNTGAPVTFGGVASSSARFSQSNNCGTVAWGASCTMTVTYNPANAGGDSGSLTLSSTAHGSPHGVTVWAANAQTPRFVNISTRAQAIGGDDVLIGGFVIQGTAPKTVVVRARGPSLAQFGIYNNLANPQLQLFSGQAQIAYNNDYTTASNLAQLQATGFAPTDSREAAILMTLQPGAYTAIVTGVAGGTGVSIVEVFEVDRFEVPLVNISTRAPVRTGNDLMIGGFIIHGNAPKTVLVRARGPSLAQFGVANVLANPSLQLVRSDGAVIAANDDWGTGTNGPQVTATGLAPTNPLESAILITLNPGAYTALVTGVGGGTGVGIVEVFAQ